MNHIADNIQYSAPETRAREMERERRYGYGQHEGDFVEDPLGVVDEIVDYLGEEARGYAALLLHILQYLELLINHILDLSCQGKGQVSQVAKADRT